MITLKLTEMDNANLCVIAPIEVRKWMEEKMLNGLIDTLIWVFVIALFALGCLAVFTVIYAVIAVMIQDRKNKDDDKE